MSSKLTDAERAKAQDKGIDRGAERGEPVEQASSCQVLPFTPRRKTPPPPEDSGPGAA